MFSAKRRTAIVDFFQLSGFLEVLSCSNLVSTFMWHPGEMHELKWLAKQLWQTVLERYQKCLEKLSYWGLKCKFYDCLGQMNIPGIGGENRWQQSLIREYYTLSHTIKGIIKSTTLWAEANNNAWVVAKRNYGWGPNCKLWGVDKETPTVLSTSSKGLYSKEMDYCLVHYDHTHLWWALSVYCFNVLWKKRSCRVCTKK